MSATIAPIDATADDRRARRNVLRLAIAQALAGANATVIYASGAIIGSTLAPSPALATLPISIFVVGMAAATLPAGWLSRHYGRRAAFMAGTGCGVITGLVAMLAVILGVFPLYCVATFLGGAYTAVVQSFRFAAADVATPAFRPRAIAWVMLGGIFAGVLGPQIVTWTMDAWAPYVFAASYAAQAVVALVSMAVLAGVELPRPAPASAGGGRPLAVIIRQPRFITAAVCGVVSYLLMNFLMTAAPLAMHLCGLPIVTSNIALQSHVIAMYAPSFVTGAVIARFGAGRVVAVGLVLLVACVLVARSGMTFTHFSAAMILLGLGWNFGFIGASNMVLETHRPEERHKVQAFNDFLVFGTIAVGSFISGGVLADYGWATVNLVALPPIAIAFVVLAAGARRRVPALP